MKTILDFGAGYEARHTAHLRALGADITAYDFGRNLTERHDPKALQRQYDLVFASNVLNTHITPRALRATVAQIATATAYDAGSALVNFPQSPRKLPELDSRGLANIFCEFFDGVEYYGYPKPVTHPNVWQLYYPRHLKAAAYLEGFHFTPEEIAAANIRPTGAVGARAIVPRLVGELYFHPCTSPR